MHVVTPAEVCAKTDESLAVWHVESCRLK